MISAWVASMFRNLSVIVAMTRSFSLALASAFSRRAPATLRSLTVVRNVHDRLQDHVVRQLALRAPEIPTAEILQIVSVDALLADEDAGRIVGNGVFGEEICQVVP